MAAPATHLLLHLLLLLLLVLPLPLSLSPSPTSRLPPLPISLSLSPSLPVQRRPLAEAAPPAGGAPARVDPGCPHASPPSSPWDPQHLLPMVSVCSAPP
jgi:hypothetical protein